MDLASKLKGIKLVAMDVDGVLTEGQIIYGSDGMELKCFNARDGHGIKLLQRAGLKSAIITGRQSEAVLRRAEELGISCLIQNSKNKVEALNEIIRTTALLEHEIAYIGDDLVDIPVMRRVGVAVAPCDGHDLAKQYASIITNLPGGRGAVREFIEILLQAQSKWEELISKYIN